MSGVLGVLAGGYAGGTVAPTVIQLTAPNDFSDGSWSRLNCGFNSNNNLAPDNTNTASAVTCSTSVGFAACRTTIPITMASGTHYSLTGYIKDSTTPVWAEIAIGDSLAGVQGEVEFWVDATSGAGAAGTSTVYGTGVVDSFSVTAATGPGNNYSKIDMVFHFTSTPASDNYVDIRFVDSNGGTTPTNLQAFLLWGWGA